MRWRLLDRGDPNLATHRSRHGSPATAGRSAHGDGGLETDLIFNHGVELEEYAVYPLLRDTAGRELLTDYCDGYASHVARLWDVDPRVVDRDRLR